MNNKIERSHLDLVSTIARSFSAKSSLDYISLEAYLREKLLDVIKNFKKRDDGTPFNVYAKKSLNGHCKNYLRDVVLPPSIPRKHIADWVRYNKLKRENFPEESLQYFIGVAPEILEERSQTITNLRYGHSELQPWARLESQANSDSIRKLKEMIDDGLTPEQACEKGLDDMDLVDLIKDYCD